jgi:hypothetical protein
LTPPHRNQQPNSYELSGQASAGSEEGPAEASV